ncbi:hypothetical protein GCM10023189_01650 [Nibrella saemangeumensis]|uniref:OmpA-like domain-containing protein n=1 Tax=Nibrella saemangeumensis TaxID=1084526 RepID=A0ABP8MA55_9BACT
MLGYQVALAQSDSLLQQADRHLTRRVFGRAIDVYSELLGQYRNQLTPEQLTTVQANLAYAYSQVGDLQKAERTYREWFTDTDPESQKAAPLLAFAQTLAGNGKFQEAQQQYERYLRLKDNRAAIQPVQIQTSGKRQPTRYRLEVPAFNTTNEEFSPAYYKDGLVYVAGKKGSFAIETTGSGGGSGYLDLFYIPDRSQIRVNRVINADGTDSKPSAGRPERRADTGGRRLGSDAYTRTSANDTRTVPGFEAGINISRGLGYEVQPVDPVQRFSQALNTRYHEGPATFLHDGSGIIFTRNNYNDGKAKKSSDNINKLKLYSADYQNGTWHNVQELPFNSDEYSVGHPALSYDDQLLFFASDMPGGFGGTDIYVSRRENGRWSKPVNLGKEINTKGNELFPFVDENGNLYFSTDGRRGLGGLDIFYVTMQGTTVQAVDHLDAPINSSKDDFGLITDGNRQSGYLSSNRQNNNDDIYRFVREGAIGGCRALTIRVYDADDSQGTDSVTVYVRRQGGDPPVQQVKTAANGELHLCLEPNSNFTFTALREGFASSTIGFSTRYLTDDQPTRLEIPLQKLEDGIENIDENGADSTLSEDAVAVPVMRSHIQGTIISEKDGKPMAGVTVQLRNECDGNIVQVVTGPDGHYTFNLSDDCDYTLVASKDAFGTNANRVRRATTTPVRRPKSKALSADLRMLGVGDVITVGNIYYDLDRYSLRSNATSELDKLVATMLKYPGLAIEVRSHTDSQGDAQYNLELSNRRARAVADFLVSRGVARRRIRATGYGEGMLLNNCRDGVICTEAEHQRNRRTEFKVLSIK